ncbi:hypothetical protein M5E89_13665 [Acidaminococcus intestini]|nr:hypothetical protein M5E89_13665 [Acidaminococcus intestini]
MPELGVSNAQLILAAKQTAYMVFVSLAAGTVLAMIMAFALVLTRSDSILPNRFIYGILNTIINTVRSVPFIILMVFIMPLTKMVVGTRIGTTAALVPLVIFIAPYLTRLLKTPCLMSIEASLKPLRRWEHPILKSFGIFSCRKQKDPSSFPLRQGQSAF